MTLKREEKKPKEKKLFNLNQSLIEQLELLPESLTKTNLLEQANKLSPICHAYGEAMRLSDFVCTCYGKMQNRVFEYIRYIDSNLVKITNSKIIDRLTTMQQQLQLLPSNDRTTEIENCIVNMKKQIKAYSEVIRLCGEICGAVSDGAEFLDIIIFFKPLKAELYKIYIN